MSPQERPMYRIPKIFQNQPGLIAAESTRHGGVSTTPYKSLNLGGQGADTTENIIENNLRFFGALEVPFKQVAKTHQVHGNLVLSVNEPGRYEGYDALITNCPEIQLAVTIADCTPILLYDPASRSVAAIHAGWRGTVGNIALHTIENMKQLFGTQPDTCLAYIGTCIDFDSFEVGPEVAQHFDSAFQKPADMEGKFLVDLKEANRAQLMQAGLHSSHIEISPYSTAKHLFDYFSYRFEKGQTGRMLATIGMRTL
ncbi:peptidoglycan editing factor PgeF [Dyadobacter tibetensis]|uniref:peptidoglycan editing factor PgeF n=1 Tax=Dyadobacter tibetensis TaxID=1211851 RepID=UPI0004703E6E|nr:peptidoglycan editing factor PgeF [Dyadobacter tibetensis]